MSMEEIFYSNGYMHGMEKGYEKCLEEIRAIAISLKKEDGNLDSLVKILDKIDPKLF